MKSILTINGAPSNIKFALSDIGKPLKRGDDVSGHDEAAPIKLTGGQPKKSQTPEILAVDVGAHGVLEARNP